MSETWTDDALERFRIEYLKYRGALVDRVTNLPAYPLLFDTLKTMLDQRRFLGVIHLEIVNLDLVESLYGWQVFDRILARTADALRAAVGRELPSNALLAVNGVAGDRFVVFLPEDHGGGDVDAPGLAGTCRDLRRALEEHFSADDFASLSPRLSFRLGHAFCSENPFFRFERRVHAAVDEARTMDARRRRRLQRTSSAEMRRIIENAAVSTLFQPVVDLGTGEAIGYEALSRGPKDSTLEMPRAMFELSGRLGIALDLDRICRASALRASRSIAREGSKIFLNVLAGSLHDPAWLEAPAPADAEPGPAPASVVIELSERGPEADLERTASALKQLREAGFALALDDVGTGYSSLATVERLRPEFVKVDVSLVRGVHQNLIKQELLRSLVAVAGRVGAAVVAEGVESEEEAGMLRDAGARYAQGFLFAQPAPAGAARRTGSPETDH
jgi:EAL domain-containing protein (putative c-di-GMP-specific phosphodiesterase class I)/GGDEF domain-containing protein